MWVDGAVMQTCDLVEAKHVGNPASSPVIGNARLSPLNETWKIEFQGELLRLNAFVTDPSTPARGIQVITNDARAISNLTSIATELGVEKVKVVVVPSTK
jgi:hypothetical protein